MPGSRNAFPASSPLAAVPYSPSLARQLPSVAAPDIRRDRFIGFARDEQSANVLHEVLGGYVPNTNQVHVVDFRSALHILASMPTPEVILVDLSGEDQPLNAMMELAEVVETGTTLLAIGDIHTVNFYRTVTKGMGAREYLPKPLTPAAVEKSFLPLIASRGAGEQSRRAGRVVTVVGARGGVGTSTIASNLAWYTATEMHRHTVLLDGEFNTGTVALNFNLRTTNGLASALETPERVDQLLIERSLQEAGDRLHVLAGLEDLNRSVAFTAQSAATFLHTVRSRFNYVVADAGSRLEPFSRDLLFNTQQRVFVLDPTIISIRNLERLLALPGGSSQSPRVTLVLNKATTPGGLTQSYMERAMGMRFDAVIPDLPRIVPHTTHMGTQAAGLRGPFRSGIADLVSALGVVNHEVAEVQAVPA